jgi:hypothetical protein
VSLDHPGRLTDHLYAMRLAGSEAHMAASEDGGLNGPFRDLLFGINSVVDATLALVEAELERNAKQR